MAIQWACRQAPGSGLRRLGIGRDEWRHAPLRQPGREHRRQHPVPALTGVQPVHSPHALVVDLGARRQIDVDEVVADRELAQRRIDLVGPAGQRSADRGRDPEQQPGVGQARGEHHGPGVLQCRDDVLQVGGDRPGVELPAQRVVDADQDRRDGRPHGERPGQLLTGYVPDQGTTAGQVAQLHLIRRSQEPASRAAQPRQPPCGIWSPIPRVTESPRAAKRTTAPRCPVSGAVVTTGSRPGRGPRTWPRSRPPQGRHISRPARARAGSRAPRPASRTARPAGGPPPAPGHVSFQQVHDRVGARRIAVFRGQPGRPDDPGQRTVAADHRRRPAGQRLEGGKAERLDRPGRDHHVGGGQEPGQQPAVGHVPQEPDGQATGLVLQRLAPRAVPGDHEHRGQAAAAQLGQRTHRALRALLR